MTASHYFDRRLFNRPRTLCTQNAIIFALSPRQCIDHCQCSKKLLESRRRKTPRHAVWTSTDPHPLPRVLRACHTCPNPPIEIIQGKHSRYAVGYRDHQIRKECRLCRKYFRHDFGGSQRSVYVVSERAGSIKRNVYSGYLGG